MTRDCAGDDALACAEAVELLHGYLDGELHEDTVDLVVEHLEACRRCGLEAETYRGLQRLVRESGNGVDAELLERLRGFASGLARPDVSRPG